MHWVATGLLFFLGIACGAILRLMAFVVVLFGAAIIAALVSVFHGIAAAALNAFFTVVSLQIGYAVGLVLRASIRSQ
jgi:hypothetical protein